MPDTVFGQPDTSFGLPVICFGLPDSIFGLHQMVFGQRQTSFGLLLASFGQPFLVFFPFLNDGKKAKYLLLAPIVVEILVCRCSAYKIVTDGGTNADKKAKCFCSRFIIELDCKND
ncbi:hypothetical protein DOS84_11420 [Flavobacterium aquariorum]|uniref:Uncharacterized protein n=1 Tax=Flavobacterium aquariorum TaxID=2217670 RepID=A0A2W7VMZ7_9FLAO|nr:hypothetical protein DOS84_11420 [Flavobacterium aquariorum]